MIEDVELLRRYADEKSEAAFAELVQRRIGLVYSVALRQVGGDAHLAEDVAQKVFADLARKAASLCRRPVLSGWLCRSAQFGASDVVRAERRRRAREQETSTMQPITSEPAAAADGEKLRPLLDQAMNELADDDRDALALRFFEERSFAEIGHAFRLTEDAARKRVTRALDRLHAQLARRGVTSTSAALALALANQAGVAAPAGLATSVTSAALAAAAGGTAGTSILTFMSTAKITGTFFVLGAALICSVAANAYLLMRPIQPKPAGRLPAAPSVVATPAAGVPLAALTDRDLGALRDRLRAAGADETATRGLIEGVLRRRYRERLSAQRAELMQHAWWRDSAWWFQNPGAGGPPRFVDDRPLLREMVLDPLERLFGPDPVEVAEQEARFEFLPAEKRRAFAALERDYEAAMARLSGTEQNSPLGTNLKREHDEKQRELLAALTPAERAEYDLHLSATAVALRERMSQIAASEQEYRAIMAVVAPAGDGDAPGRRVLRATEGDTRFAQQLVAALGYDRALDYIWAGAWEYPSYARIAQDGGLPPGTPARVLQLAAESITRAETIHNDAALTPAQKRAAVVALQQEVRPQLDALLPPEQQRRLPEIALRWFTALGEGRYGSIPTTAAGTTGGVMSGGPGISVEAPPPPGRTRSQFVVPRPNG